MLFPAYKKNDCCWYLPSLHAIQIKDQAWGGSIFFFTDSIKHKGKTVVRANVTELRLVQPNDQAIVLGYGTAGFVWKEGTVVTVMKVYHKEGMITVRGPEGKTTTAPLDELMRYAPARKGYIAQHYLSAKEQEKHTPAKKIAEIKKALDTNKIEVKRKDDVLTDALTYLTEAIQAKPQKLKRPKRPEVLKSAKTIVEEAKKKSQYNPEALAISELMHEYEKLRQKFKILLQQLRDGAGNAEVLQQMVQTEEDMKRAEERMKLGVRKFK